MSGFCSFLTRDASVPVPALDREPPPAPVESSAPDLGALDLGAPVPTAPVPIPLRDLIPGSQPALGLKPAFVRAAQPASGAAAEPRPAPAPHSVQTGALDSSALDLSAVEPGALASSALDFHPHHRPRIREAATVQDGHSLAEQAVYDAMYRAGKPYQGDSRILTIGLRTLAELSRMAYSNCKANVRSLVASWRSMNVPASALPMAAPISSTASASILRRRKAAGLTHVVRTRGVAFVDPGTGKEFPGFACISIRRTRFECTRF